MLLFCMKDRYYMFQKINLINIAFYDIFYLEIIEGGFGCYLMFT